MSATAGPSGCVPNPAESAKLRWASSSSQPVRPRPLRCQSDVSIEVAVRNVMHDLAYRPAAFAVRCVEMRVVQSLHCCAHFGRCSRNLVDCLLAPSWRHTRRHLKLSNRVARIHLDFLLGQPGISLDYSGRRSYRSTLPAGKGFSNLAARIPNRGGGNATIPDCIVSCGRSAESNRWRKIECTTSSSSAAAVPA